MPMGKADLKTKQNDQDVQQFIKNISDESRRKDTQAVCNLMAEVTKQSPKMWGSSIIGFGTYQYKYASGREGTWMRTGLSPRKQNLTLYIMDGFSGYQDLLDRLGKYSTGKSCLYIKNLKDIDLSVLRELIEKSFAAKAMGEV